jgi:transposase
MTEMRRLVFGGVDSHRDTIEGAVVDALGRWLGGETFAATAVGYRAFHRWLVAFGEVVVVGVEGSSSYGIGVARQLQRVGVSVVEIAGPSRAVRRRQGKSDPVDAVAAARAVAGGCERGVAKDHEGIVESVRVVLGSRETAEGNRRKSVAVFGATLLTAPEALQSLRLLSSGERLRRLACCRPDASKAALPRVATELALRSLSRQVQSAQAAVDVLEAAPTLMGLLGVGPVVGAKLLVCAGENASRIRSAAAFARIVGVAPIPASSGLTSRVRLSRGGDRQANSAIHRIVICRLRWDERTQAYMAKRLGEGMSKREAIRCLKRYVANEVYAALIADERHRRERAASSADSSGVEAVARPETQTPAAVVARRGAAGIVAAGTADTIPGSGAAPDQHPGPPPAAGGAVPGPAPSPATNPPTLTTQKGHEMGT